LPYSSPRSLSIQRLETIALDVAWYVENKSLKTRGIDVISIMKKEVPSLQIKKVFGPKKWV
jgi:hypothetical protein